MKLQSFANIIIVLRAEICDIIPRGTFQGEKDNYWCCFCKYGNSLALYETFWLLRSIFAKNIVALRAEMCDIIPFRATTTGNTSTWPAPETTDKETDESWDIFMI